MTDHADPHDDAGRRDAAPLPFDEIHRRHAPAVYRFCLSQVRDPAAAEDIAAATFASAWRAWERVAPPPDGVLPWLFRIARNAVVDHQRRETRARRLHLLLRQGARPAGDAEASAVIRAELREVMDALALLKQRDRLLIGLRYVSGLSFAEVGAVVGLSEDAAGMATSRALGRVRRILEAQS